MTGAIICSAPRRSAMTADEMVARKRVNIAVMADDLGNVSEACRHRGMTGSRSCEYKRRFRTQGPPVGLNDLLSVHQPHPPTTSETVVERILSHSLQHRGWGSCRPAARLMLKGTPVGSPADQCIVTNQGR